VKDYNVIQALLNNFENVPRYSSCPELCLKGGATVPGCPE
jgi:hypothetical protein